MQLGIFTYIKLMAKKVLVDKDEGAFFLGGRVVLTVVFEKKE